MREHPDEFISSPAESQHGSKYLTLVDLLLSQAAIYGREKAYKFLQNGEQESAVLTYEDLNNQARAIAAELQKVCVRGDRALLLFHPSLDFVSAFFGCLYAGVVPVPAYPPRRNRFDPRLQAIVSDAQPVIALTTSDVLSEGDRRLVHNPDLK